MSRLAYYRVSTADQSIEAQRRAMGGKFDKEFKDEGVSGSTVAAHRKGFAKLLDFVREGDTVCVYAVDRLGRDAIDVQTTVRRLLDQGVTVDVHGLGSIGRGVGELILGVLAQIADMERQRIFERCEAGRSAGRGNSPRLEVCQQGQHWQHRDPVRYRHHDRQAIYGRSSSRKGARASDGVRRGASPPRIPSIKNAGPSSAHHQLRQLGGKA